MTNRGISTVTSLPEINAPKWKPNIIINIFQKKKIIFQRIHLFRAGELTPILRPRDNLAVQVRHGNKYNVRISLTPLFIPSFMSDFFFLIYFWKKKYLWLDLDDTWAWEITDLRTSIKRKNKEKRIWLKSTYVPYLW